MKVILGMSGGTDSSLSAYLLKQKGFKVIGVSLKVCDNFNDEYAISVAKQLNIEHHIIDIREEFNNEVLKRSWEYFSNNRTPNPCCICNKYIKFPTLLKCAEELSADYVATGHYAVIKNNSIYRGADQNKDQSYFISGLNDLGKIMFPLGDKIKSDVKELAKNLNLSCDKKESQNLCFVKNGEPVGDILFKKFGGRDNSGNAVYKDGRILEKHRGKHNFTIGQRKYGKYIIGFQNNDVVIDDVPIGFNGMEVEELNCELPEKFLIQIRYRQTPFWGNLKNYIKFDEKQNSITSGQIAVFYDGDRVI